MQKLKVKITKAQEARDLPLPQYMSEGASGMDLYAAVNGVLEIVPGEIKLVPTGIYIALPEGYEAQVRPRSGLSLKHGITVLNSPGTIDADFRGEIKVIMINVGDKPYMIKRGERIAQLVFQAVLRVHWEEVGELEETKRGKEGFGHTG